VLPRFVNCALEQLQRAELGLIMEHFSIARMAGLMGYHSLCGSHSSLYCGYLVLIYYCILDVCVYLFYFLIYIFI
jgi:hypothetical protein